jgi:hypothetical protein
MNWNNSFTRKVAYIAAIALLFLPISYLSLPAAKNAQGQAVPGGMLAKLRQEYELSPAELGEIDPAGESMKLALVGLQGVAANILWDRANHFKKVQDWDKLEATVQQIIKLQPNFKTVWEFQGHNLAYNVSVEFDNYEHRYAWVKKGTEFLILGTHYNSQEPVLLWNVGWYVGQKMGRADEHVQFRRLFRHDTEFHKVFQDNGVFVDRGWGADNLPDNWFCGALWQEKAQNAVDSLGKPLRKSPLLFYNQLGMCKINGAEAMEEEGTLDERAIAAWIEAEKEWEKYGAREIPTTWGIKVRMRDLEAIAEKGSAELAELDALAPGVREQIKAEKLAALEPARRSAYERYIANAPDLSPEEMQQAREAEFSLNVSNVEVARRAPVENRQQARAIAEELDANALLRYRIQNERNIVNFKYWMTRCRAEKTPLALSARQHLFNAKEAAKRTAYDEALTEYSLAWQDWAEIFTQYEDLVTGGEAQEIGDEVEKYIAVLDRADQEMPVDFPLTMLLDRVRQTDMIRERLTRSQELKKQEDAKTASTDKPANSEQPADEKKADDKAEGDKAEDDKAKEKQADEKPSDDKKPDEQQKADAPPAADAPKPE